MWLFVNFPTAPDRLSPTFFEAIIDVKSALRNCDEKYKTGIDFSHVPHYPFTLTAICRQFPIKNEYHLKIKAFLRGFSGLNIIFP